LSFIAVALKRTAKGQESEFVIRLPVSINQAAPLNEPQHPNDANLRKRI
jgi:hypothetical protein